VILYRIGVFLAHAAVWAPISLLAGLALVYGEQLVPFLTYHFGEIIGLSLLCLGVFIPAALLAKACFWLFKIPPFSN
jgi:hypothetical protein